MFTKRPYFNVTRSLVVSKILDFNKNNNQKVLSARGKPFGLFVLSEARNYGYNDLRALTIK